MTKGTRVSQSRGRAWRFTTNNYTDELITEIQNTGVNSAKYLCYGKEVAETTGTPHLQGFVYFENPKRFGEVVKCIPRSDVELAKHPHRMALYCKKGTQSHEEWEKEGEKGPNYGKDADVWEWGDLPMTDSQKGELGKRKMLERCEMIIKAVKEHRTQDLPADFMFHIGCAKKFVQQQIADEIHHSCVIMDGELTHEWIYGPSRTGKTRSAMEAHPDCYRKAKNKWWDGYANEDVVLIDDFGGRNVDLIDDLKEWSDRYPFMAEYKGGMMKIRPRKIIVTSNWHPSELFPNREKDLLPILGRFKLTYLGGDRSEVDFLAASASDLRK